jgi:hypothetical protein
LAQDARRWKDYHPTKRRLTVKRFLIPLAAFLLGSAFIASFYIGILTWAQGWDYASSQFVRDRWYVVPILLGFGVQAALYSILRFRLFIPITSTGHTGAMMGTSGGTSATAMVACCIHHVTDVLPILGLSAAASFLTRYQRPFMLVGLAMNLIGIGVMLFVLYRERQKLQPAFVETK